MSHCKLIVLKFGSSVLQKPQDVHSAAQEIYRWRRNGYQVVAVVSAIGDTTDRLTELTKSYGDRIDLQKSALLLATGELQSVSLLGLALDRAGINSFIGDAASTGLKTRGPVLDATLISVDTGLLNSKLDQFGVVVLPGFIGRGVSGELTLLGRGGSDLTALFVAASLDADRCRLVKDVDGLYEFDPKSASVSPRRFRRLNYSDALQLDDSIVQHKAIRFARDQRLSFEVSSLSEERSTTVGAFDDSDLTSATFADSGNDRERVRVALLGLGTVGFGVYEQITQQFSNRFEVVAVSIEDRSKAIRNGIAPDLIAGSAEEAVSTDCDIVIELVGGESKPKRWIDLAFQQRKHVITANKSLLARHLVDLEKQANQNGVHCYWSAAVGGSVPVLETVRRLAKSDEVIEVTGILNGSTNFVLELIQRGSSFDDAVERAQELGLTERNSYLDLGGIDAAEKLVLIAQQCGVSIDVDSVNRQELTAEVTDDFDWTSSEVLRQIGRMTVHNDIAKASVSVVPVSKKSIYGRVKGTGNLVEFVTARGIRTVLTGVGAGRWPTTVSVIGDLLSLAGQLKPGDAIRDTVL